MTSADRVRNAALGAFGIAIFLALWEILGRSRLLGMSWPALTTVLDFLIDPNRRPLFARALGASLWSLAIGYCAGWLAGCAFAVLAHLLPVLRTGADRLASVLHAIPSIALAPLLIVLASRDATPAALAALSTFFVMYVAASAGLAASSGVHRDLMTVLGAGRSYRLVHLDIPAALPSVASGMRLAAPAALIGVVIGDWFGAPRGLGVLMINAMQNFQIPLLWSAILLTVATSVVLFTLLGVIERVAAERFR
jgi:ABC-type nitrate/sulfonate/bicarbonate transport system permease component